MDPGNQDQDQFTPPASALQGFQECCVLDSGDIRRFRMLHLNSIINPPADNRKHHHLHQCTLAGDTTPTSSSPSNVRCRPFLRCNNCGTIKRRSPSSSLSVEEPPAKRAAICPPASSTTTTTTNNSDVSCCNEREEEPCIGDGADPAFTTPVKPSPPVTNNQNPLNRTLSDVTSYVSTQEAPRNDGFQALNSKLPENSKIDSVSGSPSPAAGTLPPLPRSTSAPIPSEYLPVVGGAFVPSPNSDQDSSDSRRLRRIKQRMKQMNQWIQKVTDENDMGEDNIDINPKKISQDFQETKPNQEAVFVEENGDNLILHFKCPCGGRYEFFISGKKCYYRLM